MDFEIEKNSREVIRLNQTTFKGHDLINIRVYYPSDEGEMKPGKQGLAFNSSLLPRVIEALTRLEQEVSA